MCDGSEWGQFLEQKYEAYKFGKLFMVSKGQIKGHCVVEFEGLTCEPVCFDILL